MNPGRIGPYRIVRLIGAGGMGQVFEAVHEELKRPVALKLLKPEAVQGADAARRFRREMQTAAALTHPNLVRLYDGGLLDGTLYMAMELVGGETLADRLARERPPVGWCVRVMRQVADGLACLHARDICHRDVKPQNILLEKDDTAKLADFGLVRVVEGTAITADGGLLGTLPYFSPELLAGTPASPASDLWALGCVFYIMLCGRGPIVAASPTEWFFGIKSAPIPPVEQLAPEVPAAIAQLVNRMLDRRPETRPASASEVSAALSGLSAADRRPAASRSSGITGPRSTPDRGSRPPAMGAARRAGVALGVAVALGAVAAGGLQLSRRDESPASPSTRASSAQAADRTIAPGRPAWVQDVLSRADALKDRDPRQSVAIVLDALEELGRAAPAVSWSRELEPLAQSATAGISARLLELTARGKVAYERATLELAGDVPRRERLYANEYRVVVRDLRAILACATRRDAPLFLISNAGSAVDQALQTQFRLLDESTVVALERDVTALCGRLDGTWRGAFLRSFTRGRGSPTQISDRRLAVANLEREMTATRAPATQDEARLWLALVGYAMDACEVSGDREAGSALHEHAARHRGTLPTSPPFEAQWKHVERVHKSLTTRRSPK